MRPLAAAAVLVLAAGTALSQAETRGAVSAVTVYRGQALVTRDVPVTGQAGLREIVVTDLPAHVVAGSLHCETSAGVVVRSVRFRTRPVSRDVREDVQRLDVELMGMADQLADTQAAAGLLGVQRASLDKLEAFVAPSAQTELTHGILNAETLLKLTDYLFRTREAIVKRELELSRAARDVQEQINVKQRERERLTSGSSRTVNEAVLFVSKAEAGESAVKLRYLVGNATWEPSYTARTDASRTGVTLEYYASIQQMSGEDWGDVQMTLSTATPSLVAKAPRLEAMTIALGTPQQQEPQGSYKEKRDNLWNAQREAAENRGLAQNRPGKPGDEASPVLVLHMQTDQFDKSINELSKQIQVLDLLSAGHLTKREPEIRTQREEGLSVTYTIAGATSLPSRADRQQVQIAAMPMSAEFVKVAAPVLTEFVYDEASLTNSGNMVLLAGPVTAYADGAFVGSGELPTVAAGEAFTIGFGIDSSLRASRQLVSRTESIQGGNKVVEIGYKIAIDNFGAEPVRVRVMDRLPKSRDSELRLTLLDAVPEVSKEKMAVQAQKKEGILRWDIEVPPTQPGDEPFGPEYRFRLEFDKQMSIVGMEG